MIRFIATIFCLAAAAAFAANPPLQDFCSPFDGRNCEVIWNAPANLPTSVKIYSVVPTKFTAETVSNLLQIAELKPNQRKRVDQGGVFAGKDVRFFGDRQETRWLHLIPSQGFIVAGKKGAIAEIPKQKPVGVPDDTEVLRLGLNLLGKIGISKSELATNADGKVLLNFSEASVLQKIKPSGQIVTNIVQRGINFTRQIDGIPVSGMAGISMKFGNEGNLADLSVVWRAIKPDKDCPVPSPAECISRIKSGRTFIPDVEPFKTEKDRTFKRLTITTASLYYWENAGSQPQSRICPFAILEAKTDQPGENSQVQLFVPFTEE